MLHHFLFFLLSDQTIFLPDRCFNTKTYKPVLNKFHGCDKEVLLYNLKKSLGNLVRKMLKKYWWLSQN
jgi:hypothetical protein